MCYTGQGQPGGAGGSHDITVHSKCITRHRPVDSGQGVSIQYAELTVMRLQGRDSQEALEAHMVSQCAASASPATGLLAVVRARQLTIVDLAAAATAALAPSHGKHVLAEQDVVLRHC